jgi:riboflavin biosynthesis pyrimidine reductase
VFGSHVVWNDLLTAGLVDELHLMTGSAFLGDGVPVFNGPRTGMRIIDVRQLGDSQLILARYAAD